MVQAVFIRLVIPAMLVRARAHPAIYPRHRVLCLPGDWLLILAVAFILSRSREARADPGVELSGGAGFGVFVAGVTSARFAVSPSASVSLRGEGWFVVARNTTSFLGAAGGRFGINNETTLGVGVFGELMNVSAGLQIGTVRPAPPVGTILAIVGWNPENRSPVADRR